MYFKCVASSTKPDRNGVQFSLEALKQFEGIKAKIYLGYNREKPAGHVARAEIINEQLVVHGILDKEVKSFFVAPSCRMLDGYVDSERGVTVVRSVAPMAYGLVPAHADREATPIKEVK